ncbi:MAG: tetratricopeptide repeat protein [Moraxellaceae bacterium]
MRVALSSLTVAVLLVQWPSVAYAATGTLADLERAAPVAPSVGSSMALSAQDEQRLNQQLYQQLIQEAEKAEEPATINSFLSLADQIKFGRTVDETQTLESRAAFYQRRLSTARPHSDALLYEYASNLDKLGKTTESAAVVQRLLQQNPTSTYASEANFRLAEEAFVGQRYREAIAGYQAVLNNLETTHRFWPQAQYQLAWAFYRSGRFDEAITPFQRLIDHFNAKNSLTNSERLRLEDSYRTLSLVFVQLGGAPALANYYANQPLNAEQVRLYREVTTRFTEQKQPFDVAQTYEQFIKVHPLSAETAEFSQALIQVYIDAGFALDIIRAKHDYVQRFALDGAYIKQADPALQATIRPLLKAHLNSLALHYHASAQTQPQLAQKQADYQKAADLYRQQLPLATDSADQVRMLQALAEVLYRGEQYPAAITVFEQLAYDQPRGTDPAESGYFILLSYQALLKAATPAQQTERLAAQKQATLRYAQAFADKPQAAEAMLTVLAHYLEKEQLPVVAELAQQTLPLPSLTPIQRQSTQIILANAYFDQAQWQAAEQAYRQVLALPNLPAEMSNRYQNQLAASLYKQADQAQQQGNTELAARLYQQASQATVDEKIKVDAAWRSAMVIGETAAAIAPLQAFYRDYPSQPQAVGIPERIVLIQEKLQDWRGAAQTYQQIMQRDLTANPSNALAALWLAADSERKARVAQQKTIASPAELALYQQYLNQPNADFAQSVEASERLYQAALSNKDQSARLAEQQRQIAFAQRANRPAELKARLDFMLSRALTEQAAPALRSYQALAITLPLRDSVPKKQAALQAVLKQQQAIIDLNVAEFVTQAQFHVGASFAEFYQGVVKAPAPVGLNELEAEEYQIAIEEQTQPIKEQSLTWHRANLKLLHDPEQPLWDAWIEQSLDALSVLAAGFYDRPLRRAERWNEPQYAAIWTATTAKNYTRAMQLIDQLPNLSDSQDAQSLHAIQMIKLGQFAQANTALTVALGVNPKAADAHYLQGILQELYLNKPEPALAAYLQYIALEPNDRTVQRWINLLQRQLKLPLTRFNAPASPTPATETAATTDAGTAASDTPDAETGSSSPTAPQPASLAVPPVAKTSPTTP